MPEFGTLTRIDLRDGWPFEARDFTPWLADNLSKLGDALGMGLELIAREDPVGSFRTDLVARDGERDRLVVIENQLEATDHDHLGKLLTYAAGHNASVAVWVTANFRDEHRQVLDWLNQRTDEDTEFFGVVVELLRINESPLAVSFKPVAFPNSWGKETKASTPPRPSSDKSLAYRAFFQTLIDELRVKYKFTKVFSALPRPYCEFASGYPWIKFIAWFVGGNRLRAEIYFNRSRSENKDLFDRLYAKRGQIEHDYGAALSWERLDNRRASRIAIYREGSIMDGDASLAKMKEWLVDELLRMKKIFVPYLDDVLRGEAAPFIETQSSEEGIE